MRYDWTVPSPQKTFWTSLLVLFAIALSVAIFSMLKSYSIKSPTISLFSWEQPMLDKCANESHPYQRLICLSPYFQKLTYLYSPKFALSRAQLLQSEGVIDDCHLAAHVIGSATMDKYGDLGKALSACGNSCLEGCTHGVIESYMVPERKTSFLSSVTSACELSQLTAKQKLECIHGIGHGLLAHNYLPFEKAVAVCKQFTESTSSKECIDGVTMELVDQLLELPPVQFTNQVTHVCDQAFAMPDEVVARYCVRNVGEGVMFYTGHDVGASNSLCSLIPEKYRPTCLRAVQNEQKQNSL
jgi:hypothetical protein